MPVAEQTLLERAQTSATGFGELFDAYYGPIYKYMYRRVGSRALAEDLAASVFEDALRAIKRLRWQGKPIIAWLYRIAARRLADFYRTKSNDDSIDEGTVVAPDNIGDSIERADDYAAVRHGIARLRERDREIIRLAFFDELDGVEMAAMLGCTPNSAYVRLHRALKNLKVILECDL